MKFKDRKYFKDRKDNGYRGFNKSRPRRRFFKARTRPNFKFSGDRAQLSHEDLSDITEIDDPDQVNFLEESLWSTCTVCT